MTEEEFNKTIREIPCPKCGSMIARSYYHDKDKDRHAFGCEICDFTTRLYDNLPDAIEAWKNGRDGENDR